MLVRSVDDGQPEDFKHRKSKKGAATTSSKSNPSHPMTDTTDTVFEQHLARIEPEDRLVVLARTMEAQSPDMESALKDGATKWARFGETCLGQAHRLYPLNECSRAKLLMESSRIGDD